MYFTWNKDISHTGMEQVNRNKAFFFPKYFPTMSIYRRLRYNFEEGIGKRFAESHFSEKGQGRWYF